MVNIYAPGHRNRNPYSEQGAIGGAAMAQRQNRQQLLAARGTPSTAGMYWTGNSYAPAPRKKRGGGGGSRRRANRKYIFDGQRFDFGAAVDDRLRNKAAGYGPGGGGAGDGNYATSITNPFSDQDIQEQKNAAHAQFVQQQQNPNSTLSRRLASMNARLGSGSGLAQSAGLQADIFADAAGRETARKAGNELTMANQQYGVLPRSQEGLGLANLALRRDEGAANRAANLQASLLGGMLSMLG